jgi:hypothetical protein
MTPMPQADGTTTKVQQVLVQPSSGQGQDLGWPSTHHEGVSRETSTDLGWPR